jgi:outer membrane protein OmpA-like peptidoglycan-associated protein
MKKTSTSVAAGLALAAWAAPAAAQPTATLDRFRAAPTPEDALHLSRPNDLGHLRYGAHLTLDYGLNPLVYEETLGDTSTESLAVVEHQLTGTIGLSLGLFDRLVIFGGVPVALVMQGADVSSLSPLGIAPAGGAGIGDAYVGARVRLFGEASEIFALGLQATVTFPTADLSGDANYRGDGTVTFRPDLVAELRPGIAGLRIVGNVGARIREEIRADLSNLGFGHELTYGLGLSLPVWVDGPETSADGTAAVDDATRTRLEVLAQIYGDSAFDRIGQREGTALEATAGLRFFHESGVHVALAGGPGLNRGFGSPDLRLVAMLGFASPAARAPIDSDGDGLLDPNDACPAEPEDVDTFEDEDGCPDPDNDGDGILDGSDACVMEPETVNGHADDDGCPDEIPDTDGDGLRDDVDRCPAEPEDVDTFEDEDGCPDPDNDGDGILDAADRCPLEPGVAVMQGCPDPDRDTDTVVDRLDNCPDEPGTVENQGCAAAQRVTIEEGRLEILESVFFRTNAAEILPRSFPLLENVATVINAHPEITRLIVEGHTDARGRREANITLSQRRAEAVVRFLVEHGVAAERLEARGYGPDRPRIPDASTPDQHAQNRRVEFHIPGGAEGIENRASEASHDTIDR